MSITSGELVLMERGTTGVYHLLLFWREILPALHELLVLETTVSGGGTPERWVKDEVDQDRNTTRVRSESASENVRE